MQQQILCSSCKLIFFNNQMENILPHKDKILFFICHKARMNSEDDNDGQQYNYDDGSFKFFMQFGSFLTIFALIIILTIDIVKISAYNDLQTKINSYLSSPGVHSCYDVCGYYYPFYQNGQCCTYPGSSQCTSKNQCINNTVYQLNNDLSKIGSSVLKFSIASGALFMAAIFCTYQGCCKKKNQNQIPLLENSNNQEGINRSQQGTSHPTTNVDKKYESLTYVDKQNYCCVCLELFNTEKAILLKCGHIFHSLCIKQSDLKQQNCSICFPTNDKPLKSHHLLISYLKQFNNKNL